MADTRYLDIAGAQKRLEAMGFDYTERQVRRFAETRKLPFGHNGLDRKLWISEEALIEAVTNLDTRVRERA